MSGRLNMSAQVHGVADWPAIIDPAARRVYTPSEWEIEGRIFGHGIPNKPCGV
jgi:hypothetical protein